MTQSNNNVPATVQAAPEVPVEKTTWEKLSSPIQWISEKTKQLKADVKAKSTDFALDKVLQTAGIEGEQAKEIKNSLSGFFTGDNSVDSLGGLLGSAAVRGGTYYAGFALLNKALSGLSGGSLDMGMLVPIGALALTIYTGMKQYNKSAEAINKDAKEKKDYVVEKATEIKNSVTETVGSLVDNVAGNPAPAVVAGAAAPAITQYSMSKLGSKVDKLQNANVTDVEPKSTPKPVN